MTTTDTQTMTIEASAAPIHPPADGDYRRLLLLLPSTTALAYDTESRTLTARFQAPAGADRFAALRGWGGMFYNALGAIGVQPDRIAFAIVDEVSDPSTGAST